MKNKNLFLAIALYAATAFPPLGGQRGAAQSPAYLWAQRAGGASPEWSNSVATDASGNILVTGFFMSPSISFGTTTLTNAGISDIFIVKYNVNGNVLWAQSAGGTDYDNGFSVATDASGNILVTGYFSSSSISFGTTTLTNAGIYDMFIVKLGHCVYYSAPICLVTVDSSSTKNVIVWEKPVTSEIDSFKIYREIGLNNYVHIGSVAFSELSEFTDTTNGVNPKIQSYRYKISVLDTCGNESVLSSHHRTIHLSTPQYTPPLYF